jgi:ornithine cyclodeaminase/alanine dehydrogenase
MMKTLLLNQREVKQLLNMPDAIVAVEEAYKDFNRKMAIQPPIVSIEVPEYNGEMDLKMGYSKSTEIIAVKTAVGYWDNPERYHLPTLLATITLYDGKNGYPVCIMDGSLITGYRTGAAGGVSAKVLARKNSKTIGVIGAGNQARMQVIALKEVLPLETVKVWSPVREQQLKYKQDIESMLGIQVLLCDEPKDAVEGSDVIVTATPGKNPIVQDEWVSPGTHIIAIGADMKGKQELDPKIFSRAKIVVDNIQQCVLRGETQNPIKEGIITEKDIHAEIGEILLGTKVGRENNKEITIFDSTGMSIQDNMTACRIFKNAVQLGIGQKIELI